MRGVILKEGREKPLLQGHPWIFSGAIAVLPHFEDGDILPVYSENGALLGQGYFNRKSSIMGRILSPQLIPIDQLIHEKIKNAYSLRKSLSLSTNAYRLINSEGDGLPGLIVDVYDKVLVIQISTLGIEKLKPILLTHLKNLINPIGIYEKSLSHSRTLEGLSPYQGWLEGERTPEVIICENGLFFEVPIETGQKTGFFLDQREMRVLCGRLSQGKSVLNCFAYTGGFSIYAAHGKATHIDSIEISKDACIRIEKNHRLNYQENFQIMCDDVFLFFDKLQKKYDLIVLDPPAFAKKKKDIANAEKAYRHLNEKALFALNPGGILITSSCSYYIDPSHFEKIVTQSGLRIKKTVQILSRHIPAMDHPSCLFHPEGEYLKSLVLNLN